MPLDPDMPLKLLKTPLGSFIVPDRDGEAKSPPAADLVDTIDVYEMTEPPIVEVVHPRLVSPHPMRPSFPHRLRDRLRRRPDPVRAQLQNQVTEMLDQVDAEVRTAFDELRREFAARSSSSTGAGAPTTPTSPTSVACDSIQEHDDHESR